MADSALTEENIREAIGGQEIAKRFGWGRNWWYENQADYIQNRNFPPPLPGAGRKKWSRRQVERWFSTGGQSYQQPEPLHEPADDAAFERKLARYAAERGGTP
jgi:hypothetical protein